MPLAAHFVPHVQTSSDPGFALSMAVVVALIYLVVIRLVDLNEKEPAWALLLLLGIGILGALILSVIISDKTLQSTVVLAALADQVTIFICLAIGIGALESIGRMRGWSEVNGPIDGIVYGATVGLGFATGEAFITQLHRHVAALTALGINGPLHTLWPTLLFGLAGALFGGAMGAGFGWAVDRGTRGWAMFPILGLIVAFGLQVGYLALARGDDLSGGGAVARKWIAIAIPALFLLVLLVLGLRSERRAIAAELANDPVGATPDELTLLTNPAARRAAYFKRIATMDVHGWVGLRALQNRQVQLALTRQRAERATDPEARARLDAEVTSLRSAIEAARAHLRSTPGKTPTPQTQP